MRGIREGFNGGSEFHAKMTATIKRIIRRRHNPRTNHLGIPVNPQNANTDASTPSMRIVTAHENMIGLVQGLKLCQACGFDVTVLCPVN
jgi:hypothetical protein